MRRRSILKSRLTRLAIVGASSTALLGGNALTATASAGAVRSTGFVRVGHTSVLPRSSALLGPLPAGRRLTLTLVLKPRAAGALAKLARAISTPGSLQYRHYLSVRAFAARFGAAAVTIAKVSALLRQDGLTFGRVSANGWMITFSGSVAQLDRAFSVRLTRVELAGGRTAYTNLDAPLFPAAIADQIRTVIGLNTIHRVQPAGLARAATIRFALSSARTAHLDTGGAAPQSSCSFGAGNSNSGANQDGYSYDQLAAAYGFPSLYAKGDLGAGQTIALVEFQPTYSSDLQVFQQCYGTDTTVNTIDIDGGPADGSDDSESALDAETIIGLAPKATIDLYQAPDQDSIAAVLNAIVSQDKAQVISNSWGICESQAGSDEISTESGLLQEAAVQGQSFFTASGDAGSEACSQGDSGPAVADDGVAVNDPAAQPYATAVGGTTLLQAIGVIAAPAAVKHQALISPADANYYTLGFDDNGTPAAELVWNDGPSWATNGGGGGGGRSDSWSMPSYQSGASSALGVLGADSSGSAFCGSTHCREVPDVSADANEDTGYLNYSTASSGGSSTTGWAPDGGTSAAAPLWAAFAALTNASSACGGKTIGFANPALYNLAGSSYAADFDDVQSSIDGVATLGGLKIDPADNDTLYAWGISASSNSGELYPVTAGYDMATGLGSMRAGPLAAGLCGSSSAGTKVNMVARLKSASLGHAAQRKPKLTVSVVEGSAYAPITKLTLRLGTGFAIGRGAKLLARSITVKSGAHKLGFSASVSGNTLTVKLRSAAGAVTVSLAGPALTETKREASQIAKHKVRKVTLWLRLFESGTFGAASNSIVTKLAV